MTALLPCYAAYLACTKMQLSASSWELLSLPWRPISWVLRTTGPFVTITKFDAGIWATLSTRNWNNSVLMSSCLRKLHQLDGMLFLFVILHIFFPGHIKTWSRLWGLVGCTHQRQIVVLYFMASLWTNGRKSRITQPSHFFSLFGGKAWTKADPSTIRTLVSGSLPSTLTQCSWMPDSHGGRAPPDHTLCCGRRWRALRRAGSPPSESSALSAQ